MKKSEPHGRMQRRSSQAFRNPELLASLTLSAEAITIPDAIENATTTAPAPDPPARPRLGFSTVSQMKVLAIQKHRRARKQRFVRRGATPAMPEEDKRREMPDAKSKAPPVKPAERQPIGTFETKDAKWKAVVEGEIEKFMYPSLRLESLYQTNVDSAVAPATRSATSTRQLVNRADTADAAIAMPPADLVDSVMTPSAKVEWQVEKRYQNATQSAPQNGHPRVDEREYKRLQFDHQLETAECLLRKKEIAALEMKKEFEEMARIIGPTNVRDYPDPMEYDYMEDEAARKRAASVYHPNIVAESQLIPRLPQTRKIIKEIQRHTTSEGQIKYYADKQNLFTKWKKLQTSQHHQPASRTHPLNNDQLGKDEEDDITQEPYGALSPRSLFYHECVKRQVLPEPVFSRINDVKEIKTATAEPTGNPMSFTSVAATLIQAVHEKYSDHDDLITMPNGKVVSKKHHLALHLQHFGLGDVKTNALSKSLQHFCSIHILDLSDNRLTDASIIPLLQNLKAASIRPLSATKGGARRLSSIVGRIDSAGSRKRGNDLRKLNLSHNEIGKDGCAQIARFLGYCHLLTHLDLSHTSLGGDEALAPLTTAIECHPTLQTVNLSYNNIGEKGGILLGDMITQPSCGITELNVSWNQICRGGATAIGAALRTNTALKTLNLAMNRCGDDGGEQLAAAMEVNTTLTELDLTRNAFGGRTAVAFGFFLLKNSSLKRLLLQDNSLGAIGTRALLKAVASGSSCEIQMSVHDVENSKHAEQKVIFDYMMPSLSSPFELKVGGSPYDFAVASLLLDAALVYKRCALSGLVFIDDRPKKPKKVTLLFDADAKTIIESATRKPWKVQRHGVLCAEAHFIPSPMPNRSSVLVEEAAFLGLIQIVKRGFSSREIAILLDLVLNDLYLTIEQAFVFVVQLKGTISPVDIVGRLWPCLIDGDRVFEFMQTNLTPLEQRRLVDVFGAYTIQFTVANPTGHWILDLSDCRQRKLALWFTIINAFEAASTTQLHPKRTDSSQYGKAFNWRNVSFNRKAIRLTYDFFQSFPAIGILEFDYVSTLRHEDAVEPRELSDDELDLLMKQVDAEVCSIYIPLHKRKDLKYQLLFFHLAIANKHITCEQAHYVLQHFPKNYETCRFKILLSVHKTLINLEDVGELLDRLTAVDRNRVYTSLGYLNVLNPLFVDMDYEVDFEREDEKMLLRALVDLSMACPMDVIRIESERSDVLVIYSMYQTNSVPSTGKIFFRYVSHQNPNRVEWIKARQSIFKHFLCSDRLKIISDSVLLGAMGSGNPRASLLVPRPVSASTS